MFPEICACCIFVAPRVGRSKLRLRLRADVGQRRSAVALGGRGRRSEARATQAGKKKDDD